jgi:hypothetical protein
MEETARKICCPVCSKEIIPTKEWEENQLLVKYRYDCQCGYREVVTVAVD